MRGASLNQPSIPAPNTILPTLSAKGRNKVSLSRPQANRHRLITLIQPKMAKRSAVSTGVPSDAAAATLFSPLSDHDTILLQRRMDEDQPAATPSRHPETPLCVRLCFAFSAFSNLPSCYWWKSAWHALQLAPICFRTFSKSAFESTVVAS